MLNDKNKETHPSYCSAVLLRTQSNGRRLFGSAITTHSQTVRLRITPAALYREETGDRVYAHGKQMIEVEFSAAQFAEFITTMNTASGIPCTLLSFDGKSVEEPPVLVAEATKQRKVFEKRLGDAAENLKQHAIELKKYLADNNIPKKHWEPLTRPLEKMLQEVGINAGFWMELFEEVAEKVVAAAKAEVDAFTTAALHQAGMKALRSPDGQVHLPALEAKPVKGDAQWKRLHQQLSDAGDRHDAQGCEDIEAELERIYGKDAW